MLIADLVRSAQVGCEDLVVGHQLEKHVERCHILAVIVFDPLQPSDVPYRTQGRRANLAHSLGHIVGCGKDLRRLLVQEYVVVAKVRPADVPMEVLGLQIERKRIRQEPIQFLRDSWSSVKKAAWALRRVWRGTRYAGPREPPREGRT